MKHHIIQGYIQHIHLIEYDHGCLMLDGGCRADLATIQDFFITTLKRPVTDLKVVMVTHLHPDHAGCVAYLRHASSGLCLGHPSDDVSGGDHITLVTCTIANGQVWRKGFFKACV